MNDPTPFPSSLVSPAWLEGNLSNTKVRLIEIAGLGQDDMAAYKAGHVPGAACWKWKEMLWDSRMRDFPTPQDFASRMGNAGIGNDTTVVVYGEDIQFGIYAWWALRYCGHHDVRVLDGGRTRWQADGYPLTRLEPPLASPVSYEPVSRNDSMRALRDEVLSAVTSGNSKILDARSPDEFYGRRVGPPGSPDVGAVRAGRIPGAQHLYYLDVLDDTKSFRSPLELRAEITKRGLNEGDDIITYCRMSHRATVIYFMLRELLGFRNVRVYDGSWTEWGNLVGVPVER